MLATLTAEQTEIITRAVAEATQGAAAQEPLTYLHIAGLIIVLLLLLVAFAKVLSFVRAKDERDEERQDQQLKTLQAMQNECHLQRQRHLQATLTMSGECKAVIEENTKVIDKNIQLLEKLSEGIA